jgi:hypothetical protein
VSLDRSGNIRVGLTPAGLPGTVMSGTAGGDEMRQCAKVLCFSALGQARRVTTILLLLALTSAFASDRGPAVEEMSFRQKGESLRRIAGVRPCAVTALIYLSDPRLAPARGTLQLEGLPSTPSVERLLGRAGERSGTSENLVLPRNPYSSAPFYVQVEWSLARVDQSSFFFTSRSEIVDRYGMSLNPVHLIEPQSIIFVSEGSARLLEAREML